MNENVDDAISYNLMQIRQRISKVMIKNVVKGVLGNSQEITRSDNIQIKMIAMRVDGINN
jgi:hypothetical protein